MKGIKMTKLLIGFFTTISFVFVFAGNYVAIITNKGYTYVEPSEELVVKDLIMIPERNTADNWGEHRGYNYTTPIGSLTPNIQDGYRIRALSSYYKAGEANSIVLEIDNDHTSSGLRHIDGFEVEWVGYKTLIYKNTNVFDPNLGNPSYPGWTTFKPDNEISETSGLNAYLLSKNGQSINVIIREIVFN